MTVEGRHPGAARRRAVQSLSRQRLHPQHYRARASTRAVTLTFHLVIFTDLCSQSVSTVHNYGYSVSTNLSYLHLRVLSDTRGAHSPLFIHPAAEPRNPVCRRPNLCCDTGALARKPDARSPHDTRGYAVPVTPPDPSVCAGSGTRVRGFTSTRVERRSIACDEQRRC